MSVSKKEIETELLTLAEAYKQAGFAKLADRLTSSASLFKTAEEKPVEAPAEVKPEEKKVKAASDPIFDDDDDGEEEEEEEDIEEEEEEDAAEDDEVEDDVSEEEEEEEDAEGDEEDEEEGDDGLETDADAEMDEDIALRDACTKLYRAAKRVSRHPSAKVRTLASRLFKVERLIRSTL